MFLHIWTQDSRHWPTYLMKLEEYAVEVKSLVLEITRSDDVDITERGISSDKDSLPSTSKLQKTHPLQELLGSKCQ